VNQLTNHEKIERYAIDLKPGSVVTASEVVKHIGGRGLCSMSVGNIFRAMDCM
jgi:hypothetical protein